MLSPPLGRRYQLLDNTRLFDKISNFRANRPVAVIADSCLFRSALCMCHDKLGDFLLSKPFGNSTNYYFAHDRLGVFFIRSKLKAFYFKVTLLRLDKKLWLQSGNSIRCKRKNLFNERNVKIGLIKSTGTRHSARYRTDLIG